jgi:hypothetical protein
MPADAVLHEPLLPKPGDVAQDSGAELRKHVWAASQDPQDRLSLADLEPRRG